MRSLVKITDGVIQFEVIKEYSLIDEARRRIEEYQSILTITTNKDLRDCYAQFILNEEALIQELEGTNENRSRN